MGFARSATDHRGKAHRCTATCSSFLPPTRPHGGAGIGRAGLPRLVPRTRQRQAELDLTQNQKNRHREEAAGRRDGGGLPAPGRVPLGAGSCRAPDPGRRLPSRRKAEGQSTWLAKRVSRRLGADGALSTQQAAAAIGCGSTDYRSSGRTDTSGGDLWRQYTTYADMPRLRDRSVLAHGIAEQPLLWEQEGFAVAISQGDRGPLRRAQAALRGRPGTGHRLGARWSSPRWRLSSVNARRHPGPTRDRGRASAWSGTEALADQAEDRLLLRNRSPGPDALRAGLQETDGRGLRRLAATP